MKEEILSLYLSSLHDTNDRTPVDYANSEMRKPDRLDLIYL